MSWCTALVWGTVWITVAMALEQEVTVTAKLLCLGKPMPGAIVTLIEEEPCALSSFSKKKIFDLWVISIVERAKTRSDSNGEFQINFTYNSPYKIVPVMTIVHNSGGVR